MIKRTSKKRFSNKKIRSISRSSNKYENNNKQTVDYFKITTVINLIQYFIEEYNNGNKGKKYDLKILKKHIIKYLRNSGIYLAHFKMLDKEDMNISEKDYIKIGKLWYISELIGDLFWVR